MEEIIRQTILNIKEQPLELKGKGKGKLFVDNKISDVKKSKSKTKTKTKTRAKAKTDANDANDANIETGERVRKPKNRSKKIVQDDSLELTPDFPKSKPKLNLTTGTNVPNTQPAGSDDIEPLFGKQLTKPFVPMNNMRPSTLTVPKPIPIPAPVSIPDPYVQLLNIVGRIESFEPDFSTGKFVVRYWGMGSGDVIESVVVEPEYLGKLLLDKNFGFGQSVPEENPQTDNLSEPELMHTTELVPIPNPNPNPNPSPIIETQTIEKFTLEPVTDTDTDNLNTYDFTLNIKQNQYIKYITIFNSTNRVYPKKVEMGYAHNYTHTIYSDCMVPVSTQTQTQTQVKFLYNYPVFEKIVCDNIVTVDGDGDGDGAGNGTGNGDGDGTNTHDCKHINPTIRITDNSFVHYNLDLGLDQDQDQDQVPTRDNLIVYANITNIKPLSEQVSNHKLLCEKNSDCVEITLETDGESQTQLLVWCNNICGYYNFVSVKDLETENVIYNWVPLQLFDVNYNTLCVGIGSGIGKRLEIRLSDRDEPDREMDSYPLIKVYQI